MNDLQPRFGTQPETPTDLLDMLLTVAENLKLLILAPLAAGLLIYGLTFLMSQKFDSTAVLKADASAATYMTTTAVLASSLANLGYVKDLTDEEAEKVLVELRKNVTADAARNNQLVTMRVVAASPLEAQRIANEILANTFLISKPKDGELKRLEIEKAVLSQQTVELTAASKTAQRLLEEAAPGTNVGALAEAIATLSSNLVNVQASLRAVEKKILGLTSDDVLQSPTLAQIPLSSKRGLIAMLVALATGFCLLVFVLVRQAWRASPASAEQLERIHRLRQKHGLK